MIVHVVDSSDHQLYMSSRPNFQPYVYLPNFFLSARVAFLLFLYLRIDTKQSAWTSDQT